MRPIDTPVGNDETKSSCTKYLERWIDSIISLLLPHIRGSDQVTACILEMVYKRYLERYISKIKSCCAGLVLKARTSVQTGD